MAKSILMTLCGIFLLCLPFPVSAEKFSIVPIPVSLREGKGKFTVTSHTRILSDAGNPELRNLAMLLAENIFHSSGIRIEPQAFSPGSDTQDAIVLSLASADPSIGKEGYTLEAGRRTLLIRANACNGIFYGLQTLFQLFPLQENAGVNGAKPFGIPCVSILDYPRFGYRGLHLDVGRHLFPLSFIKKYIDLAAMYKINTFHWHLTEDQGWRIEIKKYPGLTTVGSVRKGTQIGRTDVSDTIPYGGYYTQDEAREIVAYAAARYITVIPEIEMPGHSVAALTAYPWLSCTGGPFEVRTRWGVSDDICCAGNDSVFMFLEDVLTEIMDIFPSAYIHIGGDEAPKTRWKACPRCQNRIRTEGLKDEAELQSYFIKRIEKFLISKNRRLIGWDEILEGGLAPEATVMAWRGVQAGIDAALQGHDAIMTPVDYCYFDYNQGDEEKESIGGHLTLKTVYSYDPVPPVLTADQAKHILGVQGNLWTEYARTPEAVEYKGFPRAVALAEVAWSPQPRRDWDDFTLRLPRQLSRLKALHVNYSPGSFAADITTRRSGNRNQVVLSSEVRGMDIHYTLDGSDPVPASKCYRKPFTPKASCTVKAALFDHAKRSGVIRSRTIAVNPASGKPVTLLKPCSFKYPGTGVNAMTDGLSGTLSYKNGWQGYEGTDMEFTVDLLKPLKLHGLKLDFVSNPSDWVLFPERVDFAVSADGTNWIPASPYVFGPAASGPREVKTASCTLAGTEVRYIRVSAFSPKRLPNWHEYKGEPCWIFADELIAE
jgi:hexosaminidase